MGSACLRSEMMVIEEDTITEEAGCYSKALVAVNISLAFIDIVIAVIAFYQLLRIHSRTPQRGWTRQKVFHLMIGSSNTGYGVYFILTLVAACKNWICWSNSCGFVVMALPKILFLAAFLLLLSFWVDLCHQANDEEEDEGSPREPLLEKANKPILKGNRRRRCCNFRVFPVGNRQQVVILVTLLIFVIMLASAVLIWIGLGKNPIDSSVVARVYVDTFAIAMLLLGGALACYGYVLVSKMSKVRSERTSSEMWKVSGLAIVSVICFTSSSIVAFVTNIPVLYHCDWRNIGGLNASLLLIVYYFIGSSLPSASVLWIMRELPPLVAIHVPEESGTLTFVSDYSPTSQPQHWTAITTAQNQMSRASPI
ncbi:tobamovirus multiplication protein 1 [Rutidosis leptorrhynchoides]|uniref:tobamovirus multiplication protein 1 n=1 Tax=Rutidosis leptorrhynchoides TaxID=125765 RepID=UPI003A99DD3A